MSRSLVDLLPTPLHAEHLLALAPQHNSADLLQLLDRWVERGWLRALDRAFVSFLEERAPAVIPCYCWQRRWPVTNWGTDMSASTCNKPWPSRISPCRCRRKVTPLSALCYCHRNCWPTLT